MPLDALGCLLDPLFRCPLGTCGVPLGAFFGGGGVLPKPFQVHVCVFSYMYVYISNQVQRDVNANNFCMLYLLFVTALICRTGDTVCRQGDICIWDVISAGRL